MRDLAPNCAITLYFCVGDPKMNKPPGFSYYCTNSSPGWNVQSNGSIHPPSRRRLVQIRLDAYPSERERPAWFAGFRLGLMSVAHKTDSNWTPKDELAKLGVRALTPRYPTKSSKTWRTLGPLVFDLTEATDRLAFSLAVSVDGGDPCWDDPRIYDDGSQ